LNDANALDVAAASHGWTPQLVALREFLDQLGAVLVRLDGLSSAISQEDDGGAHQALGALTVEWGLFRASLDHLRRIGLDGFDAIAVPGVQLALEDARHVIRESVRFVATAHARNREMLVSLYFFAERVDGDASIASRSPGRTLRDPPGDPIVAMPRSASRRADGSCVVGPPTCARDRRSFGSRPGLRHGRR
jgi:hypothetical protein